MTGINLKNVSKTYRIFEKSIKAVDNISIFIDTTKRNVLIGPSGCGKSTLLRVIGGLLPIDSGKIDMENINSSFVFQNPRLLPFKNVKENIEFSNNNQKLVNKWIDIMGLSDFKYAYPSQLSGGMQARVSLARGFVYPNNFLLMDEPFSSLDEITKEKLEFELINYMKLNESGFLFVSHNLEEALNIGEVIIIMKDGKILKQFNLKDKNFSKDQLKSYFKKIIIGENNEK